MAINIPKPLPMYKWTEEGWKAYMDLHRAADEFIAAYRDTIGIFSMFSRKKRKHLELKRQEWRAANRAYNKAAYGIENEELS